MYTCHRNKTIGTMKCAMKTLRSCLASLIVRCLVGPLVVSPVSAETPKLPDHLPSESDYLEDVPMVLSVTRLDQPVSEAPAAITVIDRQLIEASGARELPDLLRLVPGFQVAFESGHNPMVTHHGLSSELSRRMQVLVDGRSVYTPLYGGVEWTDLPLALDDIERIEVVRGPNAATYGANSFLGIISIITRHPAEEQGTRLKAVTGSDGIGEMLLRHSGGDGDLRYRGTLAYREDDGYEARHDTKRVSLATLRVDYQLDTRSSAEFQCGLNTGSRGLGFDGEFSEPPRKKDIASSFEQLKWRHSISEGSELSAQLYHNFHKTKEPFRAGPVDFSPLLGPGFEQSFLVSDLDVTTDRYDFELQHTLMPSDSLRLVWGVSSRLDEVTSTRVFGTPDTQRNHLQRLFGNVEWRATPGLIANAGTMWEKSDITGEDVSPRLGLNYHLAPGHTLRASVSKALRTPVLFERNADLHFDFAGIPIDQFAFGEGDLSPEEIISYELGYVAALPVAHLSLDLKLYRDKVTDLVQGFRVPFMDLYDQKAFTFRNGNSATVRGIEVGADYRASRRTRLWVAYAYAEVDSPDLNEDLTHSAPRHTLSLLLSHRFPRRLSGSIAYYYVSEYEPLGTGDLLGPSRRLDMRVARGFSLGSTDGELALVVQGALGDYREFRQENSVGTSVFATVSLRFH